MNLFICSLIITAAITPFMIAIAKKFGIVDRPGDRKKHNHPVALLGGVGIFISFAVSILIYKRNDTQVITVLSASFIFMLLGLVDDIFDIRALNKLLIEGCCALFITIMGIRIDIFSHILGSKQICSILDILISSIWIIGVANAINIIDGLDGLCAGISVISASGFAFISLVQSNNSALSILSPLIGSLFAFLLYNFYPANIFMGDSGSLFIGFVLGSASIMTVDINNNAASLLVPVIILTVPIFDTGISILRRAFNKQKIMEADSKHIHYEMITNGFGYRSTVITIYGMSAAASVLSVIIYMSSNFMLALAAIILLVILGFIIGIKWYKADRS